MSLLHFLFYVHSGGMIDMLVATGGGAQDSRVVGGSQAIALRAAEELGDAVRLGCPCTSSVTTPTASRSCTSTAACAPSASSSPCRRRSRVASAISPALPGRRDHLTQQVPMGAVIKLQIRYDEPFWREDGLSGFVVSLDDPIGVMFDNSPQDLRSGVLLGFFEGEHATEAALMDADERRALALAVLREVLRRARAAPGRVHRAGLDGRGVLARLLRRAHGHRRVDALRAGTQRARGRIHWAGTETAAVWNGYMDGAVRSGERAAEEALTALAESTAAA